MKKPVLVVMAAGMGSRYGGLKQIDPVGSQGEAILDFSLFDAREAGFEKVVIIIKEAIRQDFLDTVGKRLAKSSLEIVYAFQELNKLPDGFSIPEGRVKPWGTCHAVLCAKDEIDGAPFAVINADDYYGKDAFKVIFNYLSGLSDADDGNFCMVSYELGKTVTEHGHVARGVCSVNKDGYLTDITERTRIEKYEQGIHFTTDDGATWQDLPAETPVSMNLWGFTPDFLEAMVENFPKFLAEQVPKNPLKAEYFLPGLVDTILKANKVTVRVLRCPDKWYGVTYAEDKPVVVAALAELTQKGCYPDELWN